tara:strand:- start:18935 stop:19858 length:924 start_codon:yes stop_codon:yes gene_type:complete
MSTDHIIHVDSTGELVGSVSTVTNANGGLTLTVEEITPALATQYLDENISNNRNVSDRHVAALARDMTHNRWSQNGETIKFSQTGELMDGQHRLWACITADRPFTTAVVRGVTSLDDVDRARPRSMAHVLEVNGYERPTKVSVALNTVWRWEHTNWRINNVRPTATEALSFLRQNDARLYAAMRAGIRLRKIESSLENASLAFWRMSKTFGQEVALDAYARLSKRDWLSLNDPLYHYYTHTMMVKSQQRGPSRLVKINWLVRALDAAVNREEYKGTRFLRWDGSKPLRMFTGEEIPMRSSRHVDAGT